MDIVNLSNITKTMDNNWIDKYIVPIALLFLSIGYLLLSFDKGINLLDEGIKLQGAERILHGAVLYKDEFTLYPPGAYFFLAFLFKLFGSNILVSRLATVFITASTSVLIFYISKRIIPRVFAIFSSIFYVVWIPWTSYNISVLVLFCSLMTILLMYTYIETKRDNRILLAGLCLGATIAFKHNIGIITLISVSLFLLYRESTQMQFRSLLSRSVLEDLIKKHMLLLLGIFIIIIPIFLYLYFNSAVDFMMDIFIRTPFIMKQIYIPFPALFPLTRMSFFNLQWYVPIFLYIITICYILYSQNNSNKCHYLILLALYGLIIFISIFPRCDFSHLKSVLVPAYILGFFVLFKIIQIIYGIIDNRSGSSSKQKVIFKKILLIIMLLIPLPYLFIGLQVDYNVNNQATTLLKTDKGDIYVTKEDAHSISIIINFIDKNTVPNENIFVIPFQPMIYYLSDRDYPNRYGLFLPGYANFEEQNKIIEDLQESKVKLIVFYNTTLDENKSFKNYAPVLYEYINSNYHVEYVYKSGKLIKFNGRYGSLTDFEYAILCKNNFSNALKNGEGFIGHQEKNR